MVKFSIIFVSINRAMNLSKAIFFIIPVFISASTGGKEFVLENSHVGKVVTEKIQKSPSGKPVYYVAKKDETLFRIAKDHNISVDDLKKWNKLSNNNVTPGKKYIVGYEAEKEKGKKDKDK